MATKKSKPEQTPARKFKTYEDPFVEACFSFDITQQNESRNPYEITGLKDVPGLVQKKDYKAAWGILDNNQDKFSDFDFIYVWQAVILQRNQQKKEAGETLKQGLKSAKARHVLCDRMGLLEYETGHMDEAVKWWIRSIVLMMNSGIINMWEPFLYLAYVAKACGSKKLFDHLMAWVSQISSRGELCFEPEAEKQILENAEKLSKKSVIQAIDSLFDAFNSDIDIKTHTSEKKKPAESNTDSNHLEAPDTSKRKPEKKKPLIWITIGGLLVFALIAYLLFPSPEETVIPVKPSPEKTLKIETGLPVPPETKIKVEITPAETADTDSKIKAEPGEKIEAAQTPLKKSTQPTPHKEKLRQLKVKTKTVHPEIKKKGN